MLLVDSVFTSFEDAGSEENTLIAALEYEGKYKDLHGIFSLINDTFRDRPRLNNELSLMLRNIFFCQNVTIENLSATGYIN